MSNPRADYSPIFHRDPIHLPNNARVAVWPVINVISQDTTSKESICLYARTYNNACLLDGQEINLES